MAGSNRNPKTVSMPAGILTGIVCALITTICTAAITAKMVQNQWMDESKMDYMVMAMLFISAWIGSTVSYSRVKGNKTIICMACALAFFALLLGMKMLFFDGQLIGVPETGILILGGSYLTFFVKTGGKNRKKRRTRKRYNR